MRSSITIHMHPTMFWSADKYPDVTLAQLKLELLKEDVKELAGGTPTNKVSAGTFICKAIEIKDHW